jgi:N-acetylmuramoyl-L-alanine amidase
MKKLKLGKLFPKKYKGVITMFKIALTAGHYKHTAGKRCLKSLDKNETREWVLNDRICDKVEKLLKAYDGYSLIRTDDTSGEKKISVEARVNAANNFKADIYISVHHNAGIEGGKGGGIMAYTYTNVDSVTKAWQKDLYATLVKHTDLAGNRSTPMAAADLGECRMTAMPAVLLELGFMDSATDVPVILTEAYADKCAKAIVEVLVRRGKLTKKVAAATNSGKVYRVQVGTFTNKKNAEKLVAELKGKGYSAIIKEEK